MMGRKSIPSNSGVGSGILLTDNVYAEGCQDNHPSPATIRRGWQAGVRGHLVGFRIAGASSVATRGRPILGSFTRCRRTVCHFVNGFWSFAATVC